MCSCRRNEAQAAGLPVVASDRGASKDLVIQGKTGFVCRAGSEQDFCRRTAELLVDGPKRAGMSAAARDHARLRSWPAVLLPVLDCYRRIVRIRSARRVARAASRPHRAHV